jgi:hypothetical protein
MKRVLERLGWVQVPNHTKDYLTFKNSFEEKISIAKENDYNLDYFHRMLRTINIPPVLFVKLNSERENSV